MPAQLGGAGGHGDLVAPGGQHREHVIVAKQLVRQRDQMVERIGVRPHPAQHAKHELYEDRCLYHAPIDEMAQHVEMADIVAFELEPRAALLPHQSQDLRDVARRVLEHQIIGAAQKRFLPVEQPVARFLCHGVEREIHSAHIERTHFRAKPQRRLYPVFEAHDRTAAGGEIDHRVALGRDARQELRKMRHV